MSLFLNFSNFKICGLHLPEFPIFLVENSGNWSPQILRLWNTNQYYLPKWWVHSLLKLPHGRLKYYFLTSDIVTVSLCGLSNTVCPFSRVYWKAKCSGHKLKKKSGKAPEAYRPFLYNTICSNAIITMHFYLLHFFLILKKGWLIGQKSNRRLSITVKMI